MIKEIKTGVYFKGEENFNFDFYTDLTVAKKAEFVNSVVSLVVNEYDYNSVIRDLVFDFCIIDIFTTVDTTDLWKSSSFLNDVEELLEETNIVEVVKVNVRNGLIDELNKAVNLSIEYKTGIHVNPLNDALTSLVNTFEKKINDIDLDGMMDMVQKFNGITDEFTTDNIVKAYLSNNK
jgi:hypothetical protein